ncbi:hypothetical protein H5410_056739 [Solanum commersonii]|uniref:Uncharacterized protein n=1 Tax=Solanum commersonii TaxID=4109 RepID=A0A9J5WMM3_SOLCO|nr:hypothetical protein H5410_056739 [Solanum commersonii]
MERRLRKHRRNSSFGSSESSYNMSDLQYGDEKIPKKKFKEEFLPNPIRSYVTKDDTNLVKSSMRRNSFVSSKKRNTRGRRKRARKS